MTLHHEPQKSGQALVAHETSAREDLIQLPPRGLSLKVDLEHSVENPAYFSIRCGRIIPRFCPFCPCKFALSGYCGHVRIVSLIMLAAIFAFQARAADPVFGTWQLNPARSTFAGDTQPKSLTVRIEPHAKGEVFTLDRTETNGRSTSSSVLLYFDGRARAFNEAGCSGTQSSRRLDSRTVEILHDCTGGQSTRIVRRSGQQPNELVLEITDQYADGRHYERRLVLERQ